MSEALTAQDLLPLVLKLNHDERVKLAKLALRGAAMPKAFSATDDVMAWEAEGWDEFSD